MGRKFCSILWFAVLMLLFFPSGSASASQVRISIFNFQTMNLEASGYGTTVTNMLHNRLMTETSFSILDRKELEAFLSLNDLQQNNDMANVVNIGTRLGLNAIVVGSVEKRGAVLLTTCKVINIDQKKEVFSQQVRSLGDAGLNSEINSLAKAVNSAITELSSKQEVASVFEGPVNLKKRPGNRRISISWDDASGTSPVAYEIFRATSSSGPFVKLAQVSVREFSDQNLENNVLYYYKVRAYNDKGFPSELSALISAETALTPNPPVILKTENHIKSIQLVWTPSPMASSDPSRLVGYKLYRSKEEGSGYREVASILGKDLNIGVDTASTLDKLFKVAYLDKGLADGETYYYKLTAYNEKNLESEFSSVIKGSTLPPVARPSVQGDMVREMKISWAPLDSPAVRGYYVQRSTSEEGGYAKIKKIDVDEGSQQKMQQYRDVDGLADLTRYYYRVSAFESPDLETSPSAAASAQTKGKPSAPEGLTAAGGLVKRVDLKWTAMNAPDVEGYNLYSSKSSEGEFVLLKKLEGRDSYKYSDEERDGNKLEDNSTYYYALTAYNKVGVESSSVRVSATTKPRPAKPLGLKGEDLKAREAPLSWDANVETDIAYYQVFRNADASNREFERYARVEGKTSYVDKDVKDGASYRYAVQAVDRDGLISDFSESVTVKVKPLPHTPAGLSADVRGGAILLKWNSNREKDIAFYTVFEKKFFGPDKIVTVQENSYKEPALPKGKTKTFLITATDKDGLESEYSSELTVTGR